MDGPHDLRFQAAGLFGKNAYTVGYKDISAVISNISLTEMKPDAETITSHQRIIEESRAHSTILPARFGIMFKSEDNVKQMLSKSYKDLKSKIVKLKGKDEFGLKVLIDEADLKKISASSESTPEIKKMKKEITVSGEGTAYFLKMKMAEAIRNETYRRIENLSNEIHKEISTVVTESCLLRSDFDQIILNAAYLIDRVDMPRFQRKLDGLKNKYAKDGFNFHLSGPWAPYSFC